MTKIVPIHSHLTIEEEAALLEKQNLKVSPIKKMLLD